MNTYVKYLPHVYLARCSESHEKGEIIEVQATSGKTYEHIIHNLIGAKNNSFYYSIVRADGYNIQKRAKAKAEQYSKWAESAEEKSNQAHEASNEGRDFLVLGEPVKVGHHSEKRHRALIARNNARMDKSVALHEKAKDHQEKAKKWESKSKQELINLSMPESIEYYSRKLEEAKEYHAGLKTGKYKKEHSYSMQYAKKAVVDLQKKYDFSRRLWGNE